MITPDRAICILARKQNGMSTPGAAYAKAVEAGIAALEKQIAAEPIMISSSIFKDENVMAIYHTPTCPTCGNDIKEGEHHCTCGQKIKWPEE